MTIRTESLAVERLAGLLPGVYRLCQAFSPTGLDVCYGWACNAEPVALWVDHRITSNALPEFVQRSMVSGIVELGGSDLHISGVDAEFRLTICHESDLHFESSDPELVARIAEAWAAEGVGVCAG